MYTRRTGNKRKNDATLGVINKDITLGAESLKGTSLHAKIGTPREESNHVSALLEETAQADEQALHSKAVNMESTSCENQEEASELTCQNSKDEKSKKSHKRPEEQIPSDRNRVENSNIEGHQEQVPKILELDMACTWQTPEPSNTKRHVEEQMPEDEASIATQPTTNLANSTRKDFSQLIFEGLRNLILDNREEQPLRCLTEEDLQGDKGDTTSKDSEPSKTLKRPRTPFSTHKNPLYVKKSTMATQEKTNATRGHPEGSKTQQPLEANGSYLNTGNSTESTTPCVIKIHLIYSVEVQHHRCQLHPLIHLLLVVPQAALVKLICSRASKHQQTKKLLRIVVTQQINLEVRQ
eukprot:Gb_28663 [translate_table: standard]